MGFYLNSAAPYFLYKSEVSSPYFVDKSQLLEELFPFVEQGNKHVCITRPRRFGKTVMANMQHWGLTIENNRKDNNLHIK